MAHQDIAFDRVVGGIPIVHRCEEGGFPQTVGDLSAGLGQDFRRSAFERDENESRGHAITQLIDQQFLRVIR